MRDFGAGVEYAITGNITLKSEYLYYNLGNNHTVALPNTAADVLLPLCASPSGAAARCRHAILRQEAPGTIKAFAALAASAATWS
jgi:hypothetical protein